jgi:hypothetical protein
MKKQVMCWGIFSTIMSLQLLAHCIINGWPAVSFERAISQHFIFFFIYVLTSAAATAYAVEAVYPSRGSFNAKMPSKFCLLGIFVFYCLLLVHCLLNGWPAVSFALAIHQHLWLIFLYPIMALAIAVGVMMRLDPLHGTFTTLSEDGRVTERSQYDKGKKSGVWRWYDEQGNVTKEIDYSVPKPN